MILRANVEVLINASAGTRPVEPLVENIRNYFSACHVDANVTAARDGGQLDAAARRAVATKPDVIVAGGGDGTVSTVAGVVAGSGIPLGVLPLGTLNHFAKDAGIPLDLAAAVETVCRGRLTRVDVGRVNGRVFVNNSSLGLYPQVVRIRDEMRHGLGRGKWPAFVWAALLVLRRFPFVRVEINVDGTVLRRRTPVVFIGNNSYELNGLHLGARKRLDAGHLSIHIIKRTDRLGLISLAGRALVGRLRNARDFETLRATHMKVNTRHTHITVATDGEVGRFKAPLIYEIDKGALSIVVPEKAAATKA
ncbi:MAG: sphingosine kinase [Pseudomonadota bacterium]|nr:sphingosine kinase [Pseudomonadota bacterium]